MQRHNHNRDLGYSRDTSELACPERSDSGERREPGNRTKKRGEIGEREPRERQSRVSPATSVTKQGPLEQTVAKRGRIFVQIK